MDDKLVKLNNQWLLLETTNVRELISIRHIDVISTKPKHEGTTQFFLTGEKVPMKADVPFDDVLAIITGPPQTQSTVVTMNYEPRDAVAAETNAGIPAHATVQELEAMQ